MISEHLQKMNIDAVMVDPEHEKRGSESAEFRHNVKRLKEDGFYKCWLCGSTEELQVHHFGCEWSEQELEDPDKLKRVCECMDPYGYGCLFRDRPLETVDDIRNLMVLCQEHHTGTADKTGTPTGIHNMPFGWWLMQRVAKDGKDPIPQDGETLEEVKERI